MSNKIGTSFKTCSTCKQTFATLRELIDHEKIHRDIQQPDGPSPMFPSIMMDNLEKQRLADNEYKRVYKKGIFTCEYCQKILFSRDGFSRHKRNFHGGTKNDHSPGDDDKETGISRISCKYCLGTFSRMKYLREHQKDSHSKNQPFLYYCSKCTNSRVRESLRIYFSSEQELLAHAATKHPEMDKTQIPTSKFEATKNESTASAWTTLVKMEPTDDNDSGTSEFGNIKQEPLDEDQEGQEDECGQKASEDHSQQDRSSNLIGKKRKLTQENDDETSTAAAASDVSVDKNNSHYVCQFVAASLRHLDLETSARVQADIKTILQLATDGRQWTLIGDSDKTS